MRPDGKRRNVASHAGERFGSGLIDFGLCTAPHLGDFRVGLGLQRSATLVGGGTRPGEDGVGFGTSPPEVASWSRRAEPRRR